MRRITEFALGVSLLLIGSSVFAGHETTHWNFVSGIDFSQAFVRTECPGQIPCQDDELVVGGSASPDCFPSPAETVPRGCFAQAGAQTGWTGDGFAGYNPLAGDTGVVDFMNVSGERISAALFRVSGFADSAGGVGDAAGISVLRYTGAPAGFDGVEAETPIDLINLGLIGPGDILFSTTVSGGPFEFDVDVTSIPDNEILVFSTGSGPVPELIPGFTVLSSPGFTYCFAHSESFFDNPPFPPLDQCSDHDLQPQFSSCQVDCPTIEADSDAAGDQPWQASGSTTWTIPIFPDGAETTTATLSALLLVDSNGGGVLSVEQHHDHPAVKPQVAIIQFSGDPAVFEGLAPFDVAELVHDGIIQPEDVLFVKDFTPGDPADFDTNVSLANTSPSEIVLFVTARTLWGYETDAVDVPATSLVGLTALVFVLLGLGSRSLWRRTRRS